MFLLAACHKDEIKISGKITDALSQQPLSGIQVGAFYLGEGGHPFGSTEIRYPVYYKSSVTSDAAGNFSFSIPEGGKYYLGSQNSLEAYGYYAQVNGKDYVLYRDGYAFDTNPGNVLLTGNQQFNIQLTPKPYWHFDFPAIPEEWNNAVLQISIDGLSLTPWVISIDLANADQVQNAKQVYGLDGINYQIKGDFKVVAPGNITLKDGIINTVIFPNDTTAVWLNW